MTKVHHAGVDGVTGANLMSQLCTTEPDAPAPEPVEGVGGGSDLEIAMSGAVKYATRPLKLLNVLPSTLSTVVDTVKRARSGLTMAAPFAAPKTRFNARSPGTATWRSRSSTSRTSRPSRTTSGSRSTTS